MHREERMMVYTDIECVAKSVIERLKKAVSERGTMSWTDLMNTADILKDLSAVEKNIAKAHHYSQDMPEL